MNIYELVARVSATNPRSTFGKGVKNYALEMLGSVASGDFAGLNGDSDVEMLEVSHLLNHVGGNGMRITETFSPLVWAKVQELADSASTGGNFLIYDDDIVERLYPPSKRTRGAYDGAMTRQSFALRKAIALIKRMTRF